MSEDLVLRILREGLFMIILLSLVPMLASMIVGIIVGVFQATTQIQEQTLSFVPKLIVVFLSLAIAGPWMIYQVIRLANALFANITLIH